MIRGYVGNINSVGDGSSISDWDFDAFKIMMMVVLNAVAFSFVNLGLDTYKIYQFLKKSLNVTDTTNKLNRPKYKNSKYDKWNITKVLLTRSHLTTNWGNHTYSHVIHSK